MSNPYNKKFLVSWDEFHRDSRALAWKLLETDKKYKGIIAVTRGGMVPAGIIARKLNIKKIDTFCISSYDDMDQRNATIIKEPYKEVNDGSDWLVIDDLSDTGNTLRLIRKHLPKAHLAAVYGKPKGIDAVDTFVTEVSQDTWIEFPWDLAVQEVAPMIDIKKNT